MYWFTDGTDEWVDQLPERDHLAMLFTILEEIENIPFYETAKSRICAEHLHAFGCLTIPEQRQLLSDPILSFAKTKMCQQRIIHHMQLINCFHDWVGTYRDVYQIEEKQVIITNFEDARRFWFSHQTINELLEGMNDTWFDDVLELYMFEEYWRPNEVIEQDLDRIWETLQHHPSNIPNMHPNVLFFRNYSK